MSFVSQLSNEYTPHGWCIIKSKEDFFVFGSWGGGFANGDSWRRNSGIVKVEKQGNEYLFYGHTGSVYRCAEDAEDRITMYNRGVLSEMLEKNEQASVVPVVEVLNKFGDVDE